MVYRMCLETLRAQVGPADFVNVQICQKIQIFAETLGWDRRIFDQNVFKFFLYEIFFSVNDFT